MKLGNLARISKFLFLTTGIVALAYFGGGLAASWFLVRPGRRDYDCIPRIRYGRMVPVSLFTEDGLKLHAWVLLTRLADPRDWVILLHGFRSDRCVLQNRSRFFSRRGFNVLLLHFRGHGSSDPSRVSYGFHERKDVKAAFDFVRSLRPGDEMRIGINGISMGAAAAAYAVQHEGVRPGWMILESCYDNIRNALANRLSRHFGTSLTPVIAWPVELIVQQLVQFRAEDLDPAKALAGASCPVMIMAGDAEEVLKLVEIEYLYGVIPEPKRLTIFPGAGHDDLLARDPRRYARAAGSFLRDFARRSEAGAPEQPERGGEAVLRTEAATDEKALQT